MEVQTLAGNYYMCTVVPLLKTGVTFAVFAQSGQIPLSNDKLNI